MDGTVHTDTLRAAAQRFRDQSKVLDQIRGNFNRASGAGSAMGDAKSVAYYNDAFRNGGLSLESVGKSLDGWAKRLDEAADMHAKTENDNGTKLSGGG